MVGRKCFMGLLALNLFFMWSIGGNKNLEWEIMVERPHILKCFFIVRYVRSASFIVYGSCLLWLQSSPFNENYLCVLWFTSFNFMAPIVRIEPNGPQTLLSHDNVTSNLSQVSWLEFI